ncbi:hypothetical protein LWI28_011848 [Acer negundo]|uniref:PARP catalytic domain-containing protein n=1 Tax=Acer negundo TaxID=4023 RepID=A0AAD5IMP5_ACENE|nr:hypothetical protein LWI28_011848 [Acer negundo]
MEPVNNVEQVTIDIDYNEIPEAIDDDSVNNEPNSNLDVLFRFFTENGMVKSEEASNEYNVEAMSRKCGGGNNNVRPAWYGAAKDEIREILCHGFSRIAGNGEKYGHGLHLSNSNFSIDSVLSSETDSNGLRHVLLCRVILGNVETVAAGSNQFHTSAKVYDSGVDNLAAPSRYIVRSCSMNSHIYFTEIVSFKFPCYEASTSTSAPPSF